MIGRTERARKLTDRILRLHERAVGGAARIAHTVTLLGHDASEGRERAMQPHDLFAAALEVVAIVRPPHTELGAPVQCYAVAFAADSPRAVERSVHVDLAVPSFFTLRVPVGARRAQRGLSRLE